MMPPSFGSGQGHAATDGPGAARPRTGARAWRVWRAARWLCLPMLILAGCAGVPEATEVAPSPTATVGSTPSPQATPEPTPTIAAAGPGTFIILPAESAARFFIRERLGNSPHRVVGESRKVSGTIDVNPANAAQANIGPVRVDAGSFVTDDELRDSTLRALILQADQYPDIVFTPTSSTGLPEAAGVGDELAFEVTGDLTIREVTRPVTFAVTLEVLSADRLQGRAEATILRSDFGLTIPAVPGVAEVGAEVRLRFTFIAERLP
jgi:polyisoprenoid-binding protein YceI